MQWTDPEWLAEAEAWIRRHVEPVAGIEQPHVRPWATALRVPTAEGVVWFKASVPALAHEGPLTRILARHDPGLVPPPLALDEERGWMLSRDGGTRLRELRDLAPWLEVLPRYARLQLAAAPDVEAFLALGVPDRRLAVLPDLAAEIPDERLRDGRVAELCDELAAYGIAETIQHDDLHDGQVFADERDVHVLDWGDAVVSHPFLTLAVTLGGVIAWGLDDVEGSVDTTPFRDAYLAPFGDPQALARAAAIAMRLGWVSRILAGVWEPGQEDATRRRIEMFLAE